MKRLIPAFKGMEVARCKGCLRWRNEWEGVGRYMRRLRSFWEREDLAGFHAPVTHFWECDSWCEASIQRLYNLCNLTPCFCRPLLLRTIFQLLAGQLYDIWSWKISGNVIVFIHCCHVGLINFNDRESMRVTAWLKICGDYWEFGAQHYAWKRITQLNAECSQHTDTKRFGPRLEDTSMEGGQ